MSAKTRWASAGILIAFLAVLIALASVFGGGVVPRPQQLIVSFQQDGFAFYAPHLTATVLEMAIGFAIGTVAGLAVAGIVLVLPALESIVLRFAMVTFCVPIVAVGPIALVLLGSSGSLGISPTAVFLAFLSVFFVTVSTVVSGLRTLAPGVRDFSTVVGASRIFVLTRLRAPAAVPSVFAALQIGAPSAMLGAILGEYFGGSRGVGVLLLVATSNGQVERVWIAAFLATAISLLLYIAFGLLESGVLRALYGSRHRPETAFGVKTSERFSAWRSIGSAALTIAVLLVGWQLVVWVLKPPPYLVKGPVEVFGWLFLIEGSGENRAQVFGDLGVTLLDSLVGLAGGLILACLAAIAVQLIPAASGPLFATTIFLRSVPIVAIIPILILALGRGWVIVVAVGAIVVLFPALQVVLGGMRNVSPRYLELMAVFGAGRVRTLRMIQIPSAFPAMLLGLRLSIPAALTGALLAEWLATGRGIGASISRALGAVRMNEVWTLVALVVLVAVIAYVIAELIEETLLRRRV